MNANDLEKGDLVKLLDLVGPYSGVSGLLCPALDEPLNITLNGLVKSSPIYYAGFTKTEIWRVRFLAIIATSNLLAPFILQIHGAIKCSREE